MFATSNGRWRSRPGPEEKEEEAARRLDLSRGLLLTFNGPILRRPGGGGRLFKLIAVCRVAVKTIATYQPSLGRELRDQSRKRLFASSFSSLFLSTP